MSKPQHLATLVHALSELMNWFQTENIKGTVIGGVAASLLGKPRLTKDVDALVQLEEQEWATFLRGSGDYNFNPRITDPLEFAKKSRVLLLKHQPSAIDVDLVFASLPFEEKSIEKSKSFKVGDLYVVLPAPEDLIIMKAIASRPKDMIDIESLIDTNPNLKYHYIRQVVQEFSQALDMPDLIKDLDTILSKKKSI